MKLDLMKSTLTLFFLLTAMSAAAQAGDIKPLHGLCYVGNHTADGSVPALNNFPTPTINFPGVPDHRGGSGALAAGATADVIRYTCPANGSFEYQVRDKSASSATDVRVFARRITAPIVNGGTWTDAASGTATDVYGNISNNWSGHSYLNSTTVVSTFEVRINKINGTAQRNYELCLSCYSGANGTGVVLNPIGQTYIQNQ
jgi:hypothetical protein